MKTHHGRHSCALIHGMNDKIIFFAFLDQEILLIQQ